MPTSFDLENIIPLILRPNSLDSRRFCLPRGQPFVTIQSISRMSPLFQIPIAHNPVDPHPADRVDEIPEESDQKRNPMAKMGLWMIWLRWRSIRGFSRISKLPRTIMRPVTSVKWTMRQSCWNCAPAIWAGFDFLIQKYRKPIIHFMYRMVHNQAVAEELAQEVFLRVYRSRETYRAEARFSTWLYRIATNLGVTMPVTLDTSGPLLPFILTRPIQRPARRRMSQTLP